jgi:ABC-type antimicrobial peptide transport system permease subunit
VRGAPGTESALVNAMRSALHTIDPSLPLHGITSPAELARQSIAQQHFQMVLLVSLGLVGLLLAAAGIYSVVAYFVALRAHEIGVRVALGASRRNVIALMARQGIAPVFGGVVLGAGLSLAVTRVIQSWLFGVQATDTLTLVGGAVLLFAVGLAATMIPARRAARVDPARALNSA